MNVSGMNAHDHHDHATDHGTTAEPLAHESEHAPVETPAFATSFRNTAMTTVATVGVVGVAAVVFEAALIPGMVLGVAAALAPSYMPRLGAALTPLLRSGVRGAYKVGQRTREAMSEAKEHMNDIVAEVHAEGTETVKSAEQAIHNAPKHASA